MFRLTVGRVKENEFNVYVDECKNWGFTEKANRFTWYFSAYNENGVKLELRYFSSRNEMDIEIEEVKEYGEYLWSGRGLTVLIPEPESKKGRIAYETDVLFNISVAETSETDFNRYVNNCVEAGFSESIFKNIDSFYAYSLDGVRINITHDNEIMKIVVSIPEEQ
jgi:hypothetical protein